MLIEDECFIMSVKEENKWCEDQTPTLTVDQSSLGHF